MTCHLKKICFRNTLLFDIHCCSNWKCWKECPQCSPHFKQRDPIPGKQLLQLNKLIIKRGNCRFAWHQFCLQFSRWPWCLYWCGVQKMAAFIQYFAIFFNQNIENIVRSLNQLMQFFSTQLHIALLSNVITLSHNCSLCKKKTATEVNIFCFAVSSFFMALYFTTLLSIVPLLPSFANVKNCNWFRRGSFS